MKRRVVLLGPPGSGKGTVAEKLEEKFKLKHISTGQWFRREMESGSVLGENVRDFVNRGDLVPEQLVIGLIEHWLTPEVRKQGYLLDGFPRTEAQAVALDTFCRRTDAPLDVVLYLNCPESVLVERITGRRVCLTCGKGYHVDNFPPRIPGICDQCGSKLVQREDDTEKVVRNRLVFYKTNTEPLVEYFKRSDKLVSLNAALGSEAATESAAQALAS